MAQKITDTIGPNYFVQFFDGQGNGTSNYSAYAIDEDTCFVTLKDTINTMIDELNGLSGPNSVFAQDMLFIDETPGSDTTTGRIGEDGAVVTVGGDTTTLDINVGTVSLLGIRTPVLQQNKTGGGVSDGTVFCGMDINGNVVLSNSSSQQLFDIASATRTGGVFSAIVDLLETFFDGDEWLAMRTETANTPFVAGANRTASRRLDSYARAFGGFITASNGDAIGPLVIGGGTAGAPRLVIGDGSGTDQITSGFFTSGAGDLSVSITSSQKTQWTSTGIGVFVGVEANPGLYFLGDTDTGFWHPAANTIAASVAATETFRLDPNGNLDLPENARVKGERTASQTFADATVADVAFTAADIFDIGNLTTDVWHNAGGGGPGDEEFTVPTGGNGLYAIILAFDWASPVTNARELLHEITVNNTQVRKSERSVATGEEYSDDISVHVDLVATDVVRARLTQTDSVGALGLDLQGATMSIVKIA